MTKHTLISFAKSGLRLIASGILIFSGTPILLAAGLGLGCAEILGVVEELPGMYHGTDTGSK